MRILRAPRTFTKGVAIADAFVVEAPSLEATRTEIADPEKEVARFRAAVESASNELQVLAQGNAIFRAHMDVVEDPSLAEDVLAKITDEHKNAEWALEEYTQGLLQVFAELDDELMRERGADMKDVSKRLMLALKGAHFNAFAQIGKQVIVIAKELTPSDTALMDFKYVAGFITEEGGPTSHVSIIARSLNLPALVGVPGIMQGISNDVMVAMDAETGEIAVAPDVATLARFRDAQVKYETLRVETLAASAKSSVTIDGKSVMVCCNVGSIRDIEAALQFNPDGIGLFRTEFLYMNSAQFPDEEKQFAVYKKAAELLDGKEVIIRTLDIGGDKELSYFDFGKEDNPFLGYRAIRICLDRPDVFETQLRALLRASAYGNIKIMYPMMISIEELDRANAILERCKVQLDTEGLAYNPDIKVGMMMETPASVMLADVFAQKVAFFSIGTNDLTQYTLAVDRGNKKIAEMYNSWHPAVLRGIRRVIDCGHDAGIPVGMCGEFAGDPTAFSVLLGLGLDEFSMSASVIPDIKSRLCSTVYADSVEVAKRVMQHTTLDGIASALTLSPAASKPA